MTDSSLFSRLRTWFTSPWKLPITIGLLYILRIVISRLLARPKIEHSEAPKPPTIKINLPSCAEQTTCSNAGGDSKSSRDPSSDFEAACAAATKLAHLDTFQQLRLYAYFKQATVGPCKIARPSMLDFSGCAKWDAWTALGDLAKGDAMEYYTNLVAELSQSALPADSDAPSEPPPSREGGMMGPTMSRMADDEEKIAEADKDIFIYASEGNQGAVARLLEAQVDVNGQDTDGLTPLHWAVDRGHADLAEFLLSRKADIDAQDSEQTTPLHYAVDCDHVSLVELLLRAGANPSLENAAGETAERGATSDQVRALFQTLK